MWEIKFLVAVAEGLYMFYECMYDVLLSPIFKLTAVRLLLAFGVQNAFPNLEEDIHGIKPSE